MGNKTQKIYSKFGANERAIVDKIGNDSIRNIIIRMVGAKLKLQWTGWLQYLIPLPVLLILFVLGLIVYLLGGIYAAIIISAIGTLLLTKILFDIVTVKFKIRFPESRPKRNDDMNIFELMRSRESCRSYQTKKLSKPDYNELMESVHKHLAAPKFSAEEIRFEYISVPIRVWPVVNATEFLVAIAPKEYNRLAVMDIGRTLQNIVIDAARMGIASCWIGPGADHKSITSKLGERFNPDKDNIICTSAIGYKSIYKPLFISIFSKKMRSRLPVNSLFFDSYEMNQSIDINEEQYKSFGRTFEACQWAPSSYNGQTTRAIVVSNNNEINRIDFLASTSSRYYAAVASGIWCANWAMGCDELHIDGVFTKLNDIKINSTGIPAYDMSWVLKKTIILNC